MSTGNTCYLKRGSSFSVSSKEAMDLHDVLPVGNYIIKEDPFGNLFLEHIEAFEIPSRLYGQIAKQTERVLRSFEARPNSTGVMLSGEKGSGKTLLAKNISFEAAKIGIPTIVINAPWHGDKFNSFIQLIEQPCIILFDEFEKVYNKNQQEEILTLLDGVFPSKKLFILTCNDKWKVDIHMRNRPGRIYYMLDFEGLSDAFIEEYCQENLKNKEHTSTVCKIATAFDVFNFDMLKALVEEMNRFNETPQEALVMLNAKPEFSSPREYEVSIIAEGKKIPVNKIEDTEISTNPMFNDMHISYTFTKEGDKPGEEEEDYRVIFLTPKDLQEVRPREGKFIFKKDNQIVTLERAKAKSFNYYGVL